MWSIGAPTRGADTYGTLVPYGWAAPFDVTGHPACTIPAGLAGGLPVGLMVVGMFLPLVKLISELV